jgi:ubiquitin-like protein Pup
MTEQERIQKQRTERTERTSQEQSDVQVDVTKGEQLKADLDDLLDEIDEVLEENAEEFVRNYVQKGGE